MSTRERIQEILDEVCEAGELAMISRLVADRVSFFADVAHDFLDDDDLWTPDQKGECLAKIASAQRLIRRAADKLDLSDKMQEARMYETFRQAEAAETNPDAQPETVPTFSK